MAPSSGLAWHGLADSVTAAAVLDPDFGAIALRECLRQLVKLCACGSCHDDQLIGTVKQYNRKRPAVKRSTRKTLGNAR